MKPLLCLLALCLILPMQALAYDDLTRFDFENDMNLHQFAITSTVPQVATGRCEDCGGTVNFVVMVMPDQNDLADAVRHGEITLEDLTEGSAACVGDLMCDGGQIILSRRHAGFITETSTADFGHSKDAMLSDGKTLLNISVTGDSRALANDVFDYFWRLMEPSFGSAE